MGEIELEWMAVTSGGMNVCHSTFLVSLGWQKAVDRGAACEECALTAAIYTYPSVRVSLFSVTSFAGVALLPATSCDAAASKVASRSKTKAAKSLQPSCVLLISGEGQL